MYTKPQDKFKFDHSTTSQLIPTAVNNTADYCSILADPFDEYLNARIPDRCNMPSRVVALYAEGVLTANTAGVTGIYVPLTKFGASQQYFIENSTTSTDAAITWGAAQTFPGASTLSASACRLVAAGIKVESMASDGYNGGTVYTVQKSRFETPTTPVASSTLMTESRCNGFGPLKYGAFATYRPIDEADNAYVNVSTSCGLLQIHVNLGQYPASTVVPAAQFKWKAVCHYELLPAVDSENGPGTLAYGPMDTAADIVVDKMARSIPPVGGGSEDASLTSQFNDFRRATQQELQKAILSTYASIPQRPSLFTTRARSRGRSVTKRGPGGTPGGAPARKRSTSSGI